MKFHILLHIPRLFLFTAALVFIVCCLKPAYAQNPTFGPAILRTEADEGKIKNRSIIVPYIFRSDQIGGAVGIAGGMTGFQDGQMSIAGTSYVSGKEALSFIASVNNARIPFTDRLFLDFLTMDGTYPDLWIYDAPGKSGRGGSNDSDLTDRYRGRGIDNQLEATFKYVLPWGAAGKKPISTYRLKAGMLLADAAGNATGGHDWNPLESGLTYLEFSPFYRHQSVDDTGNGGKHHYKTIGTRLGLRYDNTDFPLNPSTGSRQRLLFSQGVPGLTNSDDWTSLSLEAGKFFSLGESDSARQRVIALDLWTCAVPSDNMPPPWEGANLGGRQRMKGYDDYRFWDKAAIYYSAEFRYIPKWNPFRNLNIVKVDWVQLVLFGEAGRVAPQWSLSELHTDMKYDAGFAFVAFVNKYLGRMDWAFSPETWRIRVGVSQSF